MTNFAIPSYIIVNQHSHELQGQLYLVNQYVLLFSHLVLRGMETQSQIFSINFYYNHSIVRIIRVQQVLFLSRAHDTGQLLSTVIGIEWTVVSSAVYLHVVEESIVRALITGIWNSLWILVHTLV